MLHNPNDNARSAGLLNPNIRCVIVGFQSQQKSDRYLGDFIQWEKINHPPTKVKVGYIKFANFIPNPHSVGFFFLEGSLVEFEIWFMRWSEAQKNEGKAQTDTAVSLEKSLYLFTSTPIEFFMAVTGWLLADSARENKGKPFSEETDHQKNSQVNSHFVITKEMIKTLEISKIKEAFDAHYKLFSTSGRNNVIFSVYGYGDDPRDLYDIPEVRTYFQVLFDEEPGLFYWLDVNEAFLLLFTLLYRPVHRSDGQVEINPEDVFSFITRGQRKLLTYCAEKGISPHPALQAIQNMRW